MFQNAFLAIGSCFNRATLQKSIISQRKDQCMQARVLKSTYGRIRRAATSQVILNLARILVEDQSQRKEGWE